MGSFFKAHLILSHGTIVCHSTVVEHWFKVTLLSSATQFLRLTMQTPMLLNASGFNQQLQNDRAWHQQAPFISSVVFNQHLWVAFFLLPHYTPKPVCRREHTPDRAWLCTVNAIKGQTPRLMIWEMSPVPICPVIRSHWAFSNSPSGNQL